ncbi:UvrD/REP helicase [Denitrovibrio acetiphilus DSM 12809]|uniref:DNA 3'-5' helicase n=1 Tax=Denitrovibrio acetiphilus (strain DSM 12809 / NBRC 114555 / N2460) TaxID=522772 RepID=D4H3Q2_DENA2|nr:UvrD-helicase domain-containing protein [Denitrovibrio acetiphilus]ADD69154.1 UvrD/REP helicase [Denitrovibrio acetiphilus DSM 12809]
MPDYKDELNKAQYEAVTTTEGPLLVLAGAGTGKTRVITYRIAHLINNMRVPSRNILAVTFTNKAAGEMKERILKLVDYEDADIWIGTFHSICLRLLRRDPEKAGLEPGFGILDQDDRLATIRDIIKNLNIDHKKYPPKKYMNTISTYKNTRPYVDGKKPEELLHMFADVFAAYQQRLKDQKLVDFDDMLALTIRMFKNHPDTVGYYKELFRYILVDEYQDTNDIQFLFLHLLAGLDGNLCVVGDDDQSIYGWRGADIRNILEFDTIFKGTKIIRLLENYRSRPQILQAANKLIRNNKLRKGKDLVAARDEGGLVQVLPVSRETDEAEFVIDQVNKYLEEGVKGSEIAILYRTNGQSRNFEVLLNRQGVAYKVIGSVGFYQRREIKDILSYLRLFDNPYDSVSFRRSVKAPPRGIGDTTINKITDYASGNGISILEAVYAMNDQLRGAQKESFRGYLKIFNELAACLKVSEMVKTVMDMTDYSGYVKRYEDEQEAERRISNIEELYNAAVSFENSNSDAMITDFLAATAIATSSDEPADSCVQLMTIHSAKGLEFESVFLTGLENGLFPLHGSLEEPDELEEERRLCYVGVTRAKQNLHMTYASTRMVYGKYMPQSRSVFLDEMGIVGFSRSRSDMPLPKASRPTYQKKVVEVNGIKNGSKVSHDKFGEGMVVAISGTGDSANADVFFKTSGLKKIRVTFLKAL